MLRFVVLFLGVNTLACLKRIPKDIKADVKIYPLPHSASFITSIDSTVFRS